MSGIKDPNAVNSPITKKSFGVLMKIDVAASPVAKCVFRNTYITSLFNFQQFHKNIFMWTGNIYIHYTYNNSK
ncbi:hypothetical protein JCM1406_19110 [Clostridium novyi]